MASEKGIQSNPDSPLRSEVSSTISLIMDPPSCDKAGLKKKIPYIPKKKYAIITKDLREKFIQRVLSKQVSIKEAAEEFGIKFSTSKAILQTFRREGRIGKKKTRERRRKPFGNETMIDNPKKFKGIMESETSPAGGSNLIPLTPGSLANAASVEVSGQELVAKLTVLPKNVLDQVPALQSNLQQLNSYLKAAELLHSMIKVQQEEIQRSIISFAQSKITPQPREAASITHHPILQQQLPSIYSLFGGQRPNF
jgi:hypothetical protein